jgi:hypothetical protein
MTRSVSDIAFTPTVKALQVQHGSREAYARMEREQGVGTNYYSRTGSLYRGAGFVVSGHRQRRRSALHPTRRANCISTSIPTFKSSGKKYPGPYHQC